MLSKATLIVFLVALSSLGALGTEDCHFNQYINSKLVSDYSAVLISVNSIADCLAYLKDNKVTIKVVAFDANSRKCCSVLQTLPYQVEGEYGWTTFEIRESNNTASERPTEVTQSVPQYTTQSVYNATTVGVCDYTGSNYYAVDGVKSFSVFSYNFDVCLDVFRARNYSVNENCYKYIYHVNGHRNIRIELTINSENAWDYVQLIRNDYSRTFTGYGYDKYSLVLPGNWVDVYWRSDSSVSNKLGFCMTVSGTNDPPSDDGGSGSGFGME